jgi:murein DD-endopeptidase MepM/ murein hydrolase activator NlpD
VKRRAGLWAGAAALACVAGEPPEPRVAPAPGVRESPSLSRTAPVAPAPAPDPTVPPALASAAPRAATPFPWPAERSLWTWPLGVDHGLRADKGGWGHFRAPRYHGEHNGIDLLAPLGTPVLAACEGHAKSGKGRAFGRWVQLVCALPAPLDAHGFFASLFHAHLAAVDVGAASFEPVRRGQRLGAVGKSGNASGADIAPHLHLELIVHAGEPAAQAETHSGRDQSELDATSAFVDRIETGCWQPVGLVAKSGLVRRARRLDPFLVLSCLASDRRGWSRAPPPLDASQERWAARYASRAFDVDRGAPPPAAVP